MPIPTAKDLMVPRVLTARAEWTVQRLAAFLTEHAISGAPVLSAEGALIGVVSQSDVTRQRSTNVSNEDTAPAFYGGDTEHLATPAATADELAAQSEVTVRDIMMPALFCVDEDTPAPEIADKMIRSRLHRLLVVRPGSRRDVVGIISTLDLLQIVRDMEDV